MDRASEMLRMNVHENNKREREIYIYIYIHSSYDERIQRRQSAQYRKRRAITVKVVLTSARCDTVSQRVDVSTTLTIYIV